MGMKVVLFFCHLACIAHSFCFLGCSEATQPKLRGSHVSEDAENLNEVHHDLNEEDEFADLREHEDREEVENDMDEDEKMKEEEGEVADDMDEDRKRKEEE